MFVILDIRVHKLCNMQLLVQNIVQQMHNRSKSVECGFDKQLSVHTILPASSKQRSRFHRRRSKATVPSIRFGNSNIV